MDWHVKYDENCDILRMQAVQNLGLATVILVTGVLVENHGYLVLEIVFEGLLCFSLLSGMHYY